MLWLVLMLNKESSVFSKGEHWLLLKSLLSVLAVSLSSGAPLQHINPCPKTKPLCVCVCVWVCGLSQCRKDRLLMRLQSLDSDLALGLLYQISAPIYKKGGTISLLLFLKIKQSTKEFLNFLCVCLFVLLWNRLMKTECISVDLGIV